MTAILGLTEREREALENVGLDGEHTPDMSTREGYKAVMSTIFLGKSIGGDPGDLAALRRVIAKTKAARQEKKEGG